jgi:DNA invertase Pin-like site-specific DNA recombinase
MKIIAYLRVSTTKQELNNQKLLILSYAHQNNIKINEIVEDTVSCRKSREKRKINTIINELQEGDCLIVSEISRLARSVGQVIQIIDEIVKKHVNFISIKDNIIIDKNKEFDLSTKVMVTMFGMFAEVESKLISERTKEGLARARELGRLPGRPKGILGKSKLDGKEEEIKKYLEKKVSLSSIAKILDASRTTMHHFIKTRKLKTNIGCI